MTNNDIITEWFIDGAWTRVAGSVNLDDRVRKSPGVEIERGTTELSSIFPASSSSFAVNNADGVFTNRNPNSPLFGKIPRYTKVRHRVPTAAGETDNYVRFFQPDESGSWSTTDKAGVEIGGDIDIRFEMAPDDWAPSGALTATTGVTGYAICGKYNITGNNRAWLIWINNSARINFRWSPDGTNVNDVQFSQWPSGTYGNGRQCVRITFDVDNGASGRTATLYHAHTMAGPWTQIEQITQAGTTSIYTSGTAPLEIGDVDSGSPIISQTSFVGKIHSFELRNGINGTLVAKADPEGQEIGATSWSDGLGNTWTLTGTARVGSDRIRHTGEIDAVNYRWDTTRREVYQPLQSLGALARMQEAGAPIQSPIRRNLLSQPNVVGYWTGEQADGATTVNSEVDNASTVVLNGISFSNSQPQGLPGSAGTMTLSNSTSSIYFGAAGKSSNGSMSFFFFFRLSSLPASDKTLLIVRGFGTAAQWEFKVGAAGYVWTGTGATGTVASMATTFGSGASPLNQWIGMQLTLNQEGGNVRWAARWFGVDSGLFYINTTGGATYAGTVGRIGRATFDASTDAAFTGAQICHVLMAQTAITIGDNDLLNAAIAYRGELAGVRARRAATESGVTLEMIGNPNDTQPMGEQPLGTPYDILADCATTDSAFLYDIRDRFAIGFITRVALENRVTSNWITNYDDHTLATVPAVTEDGRYTKNVITGSRPGGGTARATQTEGPLSISEPPNGIGPRDGSISLNANDDDQLQRLTEYEVFKRTRDELRIPNVQYELNRTAITSLTNDAERAIAADIGEWLYLYNLPSFVDYFRFRRLITIGYAERFDGDLWTLTFNMVTADAYRTPLLDYFLLGDDGTTTVKTAVNSTATSIVFTTPTTSRPWVPTSHPSWEGSYLVYIAGEQLLITAMTDPTVVGSNWEQTATVTRSQNSIVKSQSAGNVIELQTPYYLGA